jgi:hypothetical protein
MQKVVGSSPIIRSSEPSLRRGFCFDGSPRNRSRSFLVELLQLPRKEAPVSILWIVLIVVLVLALLGFVGRGF